MAAERCGALDQLGSSGVELEAAARRPSPGPLLVFFDEINHDVTDFIREATDHGARRCLAVAVTARDLERTGGWVLLKAGASDVIAWDRSPAPVQDIAARLERWQTVEEVLQSDLVRTTLVGESTFWRRVLRDVIEVASFTQASVLITGESGTGKELIARLIHALDRRPEKRDLVVLDCATVVPTLSGSEFFGHERGSFTGAIAPRDGAFALANRGTLFLDEVGELPMTLQAELLRVVQEGMYKRIGSNVWQRTTFRLVSATNKTLLDEEAIGRFRRDFYYRIAGWTCHLPSLRERTEDIIPLAKHFLRQLTPDREGPELDAAVRQLFLSRDYPGNVRELKNLIGRLSHRHVGPGPITIGDLPEDERPHLAESATDWTAGQFEAGVFKALASGSGLREISNAAAATAIRLAIREHDGNLQRAARQLGVTDRALQLRRAAAHLKLVGTEEPTPLDVRAGDPLRASGGDSLPA